MDPFFEVGLFGGLDVSISSSRLDNFRVRLFISQNFIIFESAEYFEKISFVSGLSNFLSTVDEPYGMYVLGGYTMWDVCTGGMDHVGCIRGMYHVGCMYWGMEHMG